MINSRMLLVVTGLVSLVSGNLALNLVGAQPALVATSATITSPNAPNNVNKLLDEMTALQFIKMFDPLMEFNLSRIINSYKSQLLLSANQVTARRYLQDLDQLSAGKVSALLAKHFPKTQLNERVRRASLDTLSGLSLGYAKKSLDPMDGVGFGSPSKRSYNFDEMDRLGFSGFAKRANEFDELDRSGFSGFAKRSLNGGGANFDEIDRAGFSGFAKRSNEFDELDRSGFSGFAKRGNEFDELDRSGFSGFAKRMNFDEFDHSGFSGFALKRPKFFYPVFGTQKWSQGPKFRPFLRG